jgi:pyridoxal phosphate enzyme (YggS family)
MIIKENLIKFRKNLSKNIDLVAVSKTKPVSDIIEAYDAGHRIFGENKVQEMVNKNDVLPKDIQWHMIGHLQRNKIKYMASFVHLIHGVDSLKTLKEIDKQAKKHNRIISCLLQAKIAQEETKFGLNFEEIEAVLNSEELRTLHNVKISGLMGMASFTSDQEQIAQEFSSLKELFDKLKVKITANTKLEILSMGMSSDYKIAIENGSNMIRVGSAIFGVRNYIA